MPKILTLGHKYVADNFEDASTGQVIQFIEKQPKEEGSKEFVTINDGTTNEEVLKVLIDRLGYLDNKFPCEENKQAMFHIQSALDSLNKRTKDRQSRGVEGTNQK